MGTGVETNLEIRAATRLVTTSVPATMASMVRAVADTKVDVVMGVGSAVATTATEEAGGVTDEAGDTEMRCERMRPSGVCRHAFRIDAQNCRISNPCRHSLQEACIFLRKILEPLYGWLDYSLPNLLLVYLVVRFDVLTRVTQILA